MPPIRKDSGQTKPTIDTMIFSGEMGRSAVRDLKELKRPEEGGTKQKHEDFLQKIKNQAAVGWMDGWRPAWRINRKQGGNDVGSTQGLGFDGV